MTGKTQLALSLGYGAFYFNLKNETQPIYQPFENASDQLVKCAAKDLELMKAAGVLKGEFATKSQIEKYLADHYSFLLGYLKAILERAIAMGECDVPSWLKLCREARFSEIFPCRFGDLPDFRHKFMVCLDEFPSYGEDHWKEAVFIRDTLRYLNFSCILLGTNTNIADLAGLNSGSGTGIFPWCSLFFNIKFDKDCRVNLRDNFLTYFNMHLDTLKIDKQVASLIRTGLDLEYSEFVSLIKSEMGANCVHLSFLKLLKFLYDQVITSRPGIASCINEGLGQLNLSETTFLELSRDLLITVGLKILERERTLESFKAARGHVALMLSRAVDTGSNSVLGLNTGILVNHPLFYLIPSSRISRSTSADRIISKDELLYIGDDKVPSGIRAQIINHPDGSSEKNLAYLKIKSQKHLEDFTTMISYGIPPPSEEFFTYIISFGGVCYRNKSLKRIPGEAPLTEKVKSIFDMFTPETNIFENTVDGEKIGQWNKMENLCIVWASNASHFKLLEEKTNSCVDFLNDLFNCFESSKKVWIDENTVNKKMRKVVTFLSKFSVPYLGSLNTQWPSAINDMYKNRFGMLERFGSNELVDFNFQLFDEDGNDNIATAEVKFRDERVGEGDSKIEYIITNSIMHASGITVRDVNKSAINEGKEKNVHNSSKDELWTIAGSETELKKPPLNLIFCKQHKKINILRRDKKLQSFLFKSKMSLLYANMETNKLEYIGGAASRIDGVCVIIPIYEENKGFMDFLWHPRKLDE